MAGLRSELDSQTTHVHLLPSAPTPLIRAANCSLTQNTRPRAEPLTMLDPVSAVGALTSVVWLASLVFDEGHLLKGLLHNIRENSKEINALRCSLEVATTVASELLIFLQSYEAVLDIDLRDIFFIYLQQMLHEVSVVQKFLVEYAEDAVTVGGRRAVWRKSIWSRHRKHILHLGDMLRAQTRNVQDLLYLQEEVTRRDRKPSAELSRHSTQMNQYSVEKDTVVLAAEEQVDQSLFVDQLSEGTSLHIATPAVRPIFLVTRA